MLSFIICLALLIGGYFVYGKIVDNILAILDVNPVSPGHTLIIPKKHTLDITTIDNEILSMIINRAKEIGKFVNSFMLLGLYNSIRRDEY